MMMKPLRAVALLAVAVFAPCAAAGAQTPMQPGEVESMPFRFGPLGLSPTLAITDIGVDTNIFNEDSHPRRDFTTLVTPRLDGRLQAPRALVSFVNAAGLAYYSEHAEERSVSYLAQARVDFDAGPVRPYLSGTFEDTRQRLNAELDVRAPRSQYAVEAGTRLAVATRTSIVVAARESVLRFDDGTTFQGVSLPRTLNSRTDTLSGALNVSVTPLTTISLTTSLQQDRFDESPGRDADSIRIVPAVQFDPIALVHGSLAIGYRRFDLLNGALPDYSGLVADGSLGYTVAERTKFDFTVKRDVQYSYELLEPYYLASGLRLTVTQQITGPFEVQAVGGRESLAYRRLTAAASGRTDTARVVGGGLGYRLRENVRCGFNVDYATRRSDRPGRDYTRTRLYGTFTYGL
jgi:putative beta-barrel porin BBP2